MIMDDVKRNLHLHWFCKCKYQTLIKRLYECSLMKDDVFSLIFFSYVILEVIKIEWYSKIIPIVSRGW